jgi:hypothetical protein
MHRRTPTSATIQDIKSRMVALGATEETVAEAADMNLSDLTAHLHEVREFNVADLVRVGGSLHIPIRQLFTEAA